MASPRPRRVSRRDFFSLLPRRSLVLFYLAVFFVFAPVNLLMMSSFAERRTLTAIAVSMIVSGALAVSWAAAFTISRKFIVGIVVFTLAIVLVAGPLRPTRFGIGQASFSLEGIASVCVIVTGYVLFVRFIAGQGRTTWRLLTEMGLARRIHESLVPPIRVRNDRFEARGLSVPSSEMGGDLVEVLDRPEADCSDLLVADVSGHGVPAGVVMGMVKASVRMHVRRGSDLTELASDLNEVLEDATRPELYATMAVLRVEHRTRRVHYVIAGHHHLVLYEARTRQLRRLGSRGFPLGLLPARQYEMQTIETAPGDLIAVYTDGLNETTNEAGEELGHEPIESTIASLAGESLEHIETAVFERAARHGPQFDDRSLLLVRLA